MREQQGINNTHLKSRNRGLVLQWIASEDNPSRVEIARHIGLTKMTVTNIVSDWIQAGYVEEKEAAVNATVGRNPIILDIADNAPLAMGLYLSRTAATILLADLKLRVHYRDRLLLESENAETITDKLVQLVRRAMDWREAVRPRTAIAGIGVSAIGPLDTSTGLLLSPTDFFNIRKLPLAKILREASGLPVFVSNDMNDSALAEQLYGHGKPYDNFIYAGITHGIGAGIVSGGHLYQDNSGYVGEVGHMSIDYHGPICSCGSRGCLEVYASLPVLLEKLRSATGSGHCELEPSAALSRLAAHPAAQPVLNELLEVLTVALVNLANLFDPQLILIGHEGASLPDEFFIRLEKQVNGRILAAGYKHIAVKRSSLWDCAPLLGSVCGVWQEVFRGRI